ncbi:hypothetical protein ACH0CM_32520 [Streptomyces albus]|uniref:hypothetical protein n=1 Tax=Streptomyces albus TaxID=1888 RepID=UPI00387979C3
MPDLKEEDCDDYQIVTLHGDFPIPASDDHIPPDMRRFYSPFLLALHYLGDEDAFQSYMGGMERFRALAGILDDYQRVYGLHMRDQWDLVNSNIDRVFGDWDGNSSAAESMHFLHGALYLGISAIDPIGRYPSVKREIWSRTFKKSAEFAKEAWRAERCGELKKLQQRISDQLFFLVRHNDQWVAAVPIIYARFNKKGMPGDWRIPGDDFISLRDAYRQNFELSCQALSMVVRMQNIAEGRDADTIYSESQDNPWVPRGFPKTGKVKPPKTIKQFECLSSANKELYLNRSSKLTNLWDACFERGLRNAISHADADHDLGDGLIRTGKGVKAYHDFLVSVAWQVPLLTFWLDLIKLWRVCAIAASTSNAESA